MFSFRLFPTSPSTKETGPRLGQLIINKAHSIDTPSYIAPTSRGVVPHLSHDNLRNHTNIKGVYVSLEDFVEKTDPIKIPLYNLPPSHSTLRQFLSLPPNIFTVLSPRRVNPIQCPTSNTEQSISILTSVGFRMLEWRDYINVVRKARPEMVVGMADLPNKEKVGKNRGPKMVSRTEGWLKDLIEANNGRDQGQDVERVKIFAPVLPLEMEEQRLYIEYLVEHKEDIAGLAIYDYHYFKDALALSSSSEFPLSSPSSGTTSSGQETNSNGEENDANDIETTPGTPTGYNPSAFHSQLLPLPRFSLCPPSNPLSLLDQISNGIDLFTLTFVSEATDSGVALDFYWPTEKSPEETMPSDEKLELGKDLWNPIYSTDLSPLSNGSSHPEGKKCECYACKRHHRSYLNHLLGVKEMTAWVLLQIHNYTVLDHFFSGVRNSMANGTFEQDRRAFESRYVDKLPETSGQGPRVRGYQFKSESGGLGKRKKNPRGFTTTHKFGTGAVGEDMKEALGED